MSYRKRKPRLRNLLKMEKKFYFVTSSNKADRHKSRTRNSISHCAGQLVSLSVSLSVVQTFLPLECSKTHSK